MTGAARDVVHRVFVGAGSDRDELVLLVLPAMVLSFIISRRSSRETLRRSSERSPLICGVMVGIDREIRAKLRGEGLHAGIVEAGLLHDDVGDRDFQILRETRKRIAAIERWSEPVTLVIAS